MFRALLISAICLVVSSGFALAIGVSGVVTTSDGSSPLGVTVRVEQVGGELPILTTVTDQNGLWSVSDPLLFGNIRITAEKSGYQFSPATIDRFTDSNITDGNFVATPLAPDLTVRVAGGPVLGPGAEVTFKPDFPGGLRTTTLLLRNDGTTALHNLAATITGALAAEFTVAAPPPTALGPGESAAIEIHWTPADSGTRRATLMIVSDDPNEGAFPITLSGDALPLELLTVSTTADTGTGSLRATVAGAAAIPGPHRVRFAASLNGANITLNSQISITDADAVTIDAGDLPSGVTLTGGNGSRHFRVNAGSTLELSNLTLVEGRGNGEDRGGSIRNEGILVLRRCSLSSNVFTDFDNKAGGAIFNARRLSLIECDLSGNTASVGGGIYNEGAAELVDSTVVSNGSLVFSQSGGGIVSNGPLRLVRCLIAGNTVRVSGAGLFLAGPTTLIRCTISDNRCFDPTAIGAGILNTTGLLELEHCTITQNVRGGIHQDSQTGSTRLRYCITAGNTRGANGAESNLEGFGSRFIFDGPNLGLAVPPDAVGTAPIQGDPLLSPLANFGGRTFTHALRPLSPARNAAVGSTATSDQRGFPILGVPDLGAYETGTLAPEYNAYIWETLPPDASLESHAPDFDFDGDGQKNVDEWTALTDAAAAKDFFFTTVHRGPTSVSIDFRSATGRHYRLEASDSLEPGSFRPMAEQPTLTGDGTTRHFTIETSPAQRFFRVQVVL